MKQGAVFVVASTVLLAGVAFAHMSAPLPEGTPFGSSAKAATASVSASSVAPVSKAVVEVRQAPVPLQMKERPPVALPPIVETASATQPAQTMGAVEVEGGGFAKTAIESDGYKAVKNITVGPDGTWRARAMRGKTEVVLTVDREGRVSAD
jgi:hypothetical protein